MIDLRLRQIESTSWRTQQQDGLLDALFGVIFLGVALSIALDRLGVTSPFRTLIMATISFSGAGAMVWLRRRVILPRLGRARFSVARRQRTRAIRWMLVGTIAVTALLVALTVLSKRLGFNGLDEAGRLGSWLLISAIILVPVSALARHLDAPRLIIHAGLLVIAEFLLTVVGVERWMPFAGVVVFGLAGCVSLSVGIPLFIHILRLPVRQPPVRSGSIL